ncbi:MAG: HNH endonuclease [Gemmatimonadetes bacterium]|nr:HNH endonuclease [Gemmatimonadota bacterium]
MARNESSSTLRDELERAMRTGHCAYCRRPGSPENPLTREHVIPRAKGGGRKDVSIIVPACARCNHRRGCRELVLFLLLRPRRISAFLDYLASLSPESVRQLDLRVFAELYAAIWILGESAKHGSEWRAHLRRVCSSRTLHRRRYAARRMVGAVGGRLETQRERDDLRPAPPIVSTPDPDDPSPRAAGAMDGLSVRLLSLLSLAWHTSAEEVRRQMSLQHQQSVESAGSRDEGVVRLDGWRRRQHRRLRVDRRGGRRPPSRRSGGRAA